MTTWMIALVLSVGTASQAQVPQSPAQGLFRRHLADYDAELRLSLQAWRESKGDGVVTYCPDKRPQSPTFPPAQKLVHEFRGRDERSNRSE